MKLRLCLAAALAAAAAGCTRLPTLPEIARRAPLQPHTETAQSDSAGRGAGSMGSGY